MSILLIKLLFLINLICFSLPFPDLALELFEFKIYLLLKDHVSLYSLCKELSCLYIFESERIKRHGKSGFHIELKAPVTGIQFLFCRASLIFYALQNSNCYTYLGEHLSNKVPNFLKIVKASLWIPF